MTLAALSATALSATALSATALIASLVLAATATSTTSSTAHADDTGPSASDDARNRRVPVTGDGVHHFSTAVAHHGGTSADGSTWQTSTETVRLRGDLDGIVLYHPRTVVDADGSHLVVTGAQWFSGTVHGADPVVLFDDRFRFDVDLRSGATHGEVFLRPGRDLRGAGIACDLVVTGTGRTPEGDATFTYEGWCWPTGVDDDRDDDQLDD